MTAVKPAKPVKSAALDSAAASASVAVLIARAAAGCADRPQEAAGLLLAAARQAVRAVGGRICGCGAIRILADAGVIAGAGLGKA